MGQIIADTNIFIYILKNDLNLSRLLEQKKVYISYITEIELLSFPNLSEFEQSTIIDLLSHCFVIPYSDSLKEHVIYFRKKYKLLIPDAIIAATAFDFFIPLMTADKGFRKIKEIETSIYVL